jgi:membrane fusion protein
MSAAKRLFRAAAVAARGGREPGSIVLERTALARFATLASCGAGAAVAWLVAYGEYTAHVALSGRLVPDRGVVDVRAPQHGTIVARFAEEGDHVARGDLMYVVSSERRNLADGTLVAAEAQVGAELDKLAASFERQILDLERSEQRDLAAAAAQIAALDEELAALAATVAAQQSRVERAQEAAARYASMQAEGFVPAEQLRVKDDELLEQRLRLQTFERERHGLGRERAAARHELAAVRLRHANERAALTRASARTAAEIAEHDARRSAAVVAAQSGIVAVAAASVGQVVEPNALLAAVLPDGARLQAELEAPSRAVGFLAPGDEVLLKYAAYPYQKFGHQRGVVARIARLAMAADATGSRAAAEPTYRVTVELPAQAVTAYGVEQPLKAGMAVEAEVLGETRRIYEWALEPLYTLAGRVP